ncbi:MAG TPA: LysR family transcriptional regulator [Candidatus Saccharimonadales bacterium]|nr:LysR family transcriptional regulator [Candidatus Saccharimonadales bacterium]
MEDRLYKFAALVEAGSFTKAAARLHISQPALSASIQKLERELKMRLLNRGTQPLQLTKAGGQAYATAKQIQLSVGNLEMKLTQLKAQKQLVGIGMIDSVAEAVFTDGNAFADFEQHVRLSLVVDNSRNLTEALRRHEIDIAFTVEANTRPAVDSLRYQFVGTEPLLIVCNPECQDAATAAMTRGVLSPFISYNTDSRSYRHIANLFAAAHVRLLPTFYSSSSPTVMLRLVTAGRGATVLPYLTVREPLAARQVVALPLAGNYVIGRPITALTLRGSSLAPFVQAAIRQVDQTLRQLQAQSAQIDSQNT